MAQLDEFAKTVYAHCRAKLSKHLIGILDASGDYPLLIGTGVLLQVADRHFIITAAHVVDSVNSPTKTVRITAGFEDTKVIPCKTKRLLSTLRGRRPEDDHIDLAVIELEEETVGLLKQQLQFMTTYDIDGTEKPDQSHYYLLMGLPCVNFRELTPELFYSGVLLLMTSIYKCDRGNVDNFNPEHHLILDYSDHGLQGFDGTPWELPNPRGASGCGIWRISKTKTSLGLFRENDCKLVAIQQSWNRDRLYVKSTLIGYALAMIDHEYKDLRGPLSLEL